MEFLAKRARNVELNGTDSKPTWSIHHWDKLQLKSKMCIYSISIVMSPSVWWFVFPRLLWFWFLYPPIQFYPWIYSNVLKIPASGRLLQESLQIVVISNQLWRYKIRHSLLSFVCKHILYESLINSIIIRLWPQGHWPICLALVVDSFCCYFLVHNAIFLIPHLLLLHKWLNI